MLISAMLLVWGCVDETPDQPPPPSTPVRAEDKAVETDNPEPESLGTSSTDDTCRAYFTERDTQAMFAVLSDMKSGCAFEGVTVEGATMTLRYKTDAETEVKTVVKSAACEGPGPTSGGLRFMPEAAFETNCRETLIQLRSASEAAQLPAPHPREAP